MSVADELRAVAARLRAERDVSPYGASEPTIDEILEEAGTIPYVFEAGFVREAGEAYNPTAVRWWIYADDGDGFLFARGGREPTEQSAGSELAAARGTLELERAAWRNRRTHELLHGQIVRRFTHELTEDGQLRPLTPSDFEVDDVS